MITPIKILESISRKCDVSIDEIKGESRVRNIVESRFLFCLIAREETKISYQSIGNYVNRDHATVFNSILKIKDLIEIYPYLKSLYKEIKNEITME